MEDFIAMCKERTVEAMDRFLHDLSFVPLDKLTWSPTPTAKSALEIAAHCAGYSGAFASIISAGKFPSSREEFLGPIQSAIDSIVTLEQAETMLRQGIADTIAALDTVKPEQIGTIIDAPHGRPPFRFFLTLPAMHLENHAAQIAYLQTCWGDLEVHL
ncbi:MAG: DinB family protein [Capsulimonadaceae bacterium]|nr:DinB family protein [Capsulimonadaceae bacterium]